ncbi:S8 family serine peptidase [Bradyrhizobium liaoningense]|uniref:S8 family serine peptidase n=1 Tax=Bradyrhizobium liaoningense TaxID=43992 RepID=UPI001BA97D45|nr:S8 family serine peptidase [Bradyrhizobium liaoningense]MBR0941572.1 S8 family serine peptidase [Bradyrhizobium liaoningense]
MQRILVKAAPGFSAPQLNFGASAVTFATSRLFRSIDSQPALGAAGAEVWHILTPPPGFAEANTWDVCHALMQQGLGVVGSPALTFAEPDLEQKWATGKSSEGGQSLAQSCESSDTQSSDFPRDSDNYWFRAASHSQFDSAITAIGGPQVSSKVRIAHFDTGYDPDHHTLPKRLRRDIGRNFVDDDNPNDASDQTSGLLTNVGHGTGTLSILAGTALPGQPPLGGAPFAEIVPVRVANRVVLFSNSSIARAFDYVHGLNANGTNRVDIITMSMGGLASQAWADAVNALYEQGVFIVTAAGNNFGNLPTHNIVYPARFNRVVAACGVMANGKPYADLEIRLMAGNYGPDSKMSTAVAAPTPNVPWARFGCSNIVDFDGQGTSAATPQVAAAAAIWLQKNRTAVDGYLQAWMRVEAIRNALFDSAKRNEQEVRRLGRGELRASDALAVLPAAASTLRLTAPDAVSFPILQILTGLGITTMPDSPQRRMLELEALQLSQNTDIESIIPTDPAAASPADLRRLAAKLVAHPRASNALRLALGGAATNIPVGNSTPPKPLGNAVLTVQLEHAKRPRPPKPTIRPLRVYAYDPSLGAKLDTLGINEATLEVHWEDDLKQGPIGEYIEVIDIDPASQCCYAPVDLNHPHILTRSGLTPSEANPQFHQQMVYAVAMKTIEYFEKALGRVALWAPREIVVPQETHASETEKCPDAEPTKKLEYVQRLRIYPHALRAKNAYYSPEHKALLLGYFSGSGSAAAGLMQGSVIFTAVSHDVVAHETTHALLDGVHRRFREATNPDVFAFHEAFADIVAIFQHFTLPEALSHQIKATRGDLEQQNLLGQLAVQFGEATGRYGALRDYIGDIEKPKEGSGEKGKWVRREPKQSDYDDARAMGDPHAIGAVMVAAVFDAFLQIYKRRTEDLLRLATGGTGVLPVGAISTDLVSRLAREASKVASQILNICIRALDYCPPVDIVLGEYLRALVTADTDLVPYDRLGYRIAFIEAFRNRGIYPRDVKHLSPGSLVWEPPPLPLRQVKVQEVLEKMSTDWDLKSERKEAFNLSNENARVLWRWLMDKTAVNDDELAALGLVRIPKPIPYKIGSQEGCLRRIEVHSVRPVRRVGPDGNIRSDLVVEITQSFRPKGMPGVRFRGGCTLIIDLATAEVRYMVRKKVDSAWRFANQMGFAADTSDGLHGNYFVDPANAREPFALMHHVHG